MYNPALSCYIRNKPFFNVIENFQVDPCHGTITSYQSDVIPGAAGHAPVTICVSVEPAQTFTFTFT